MPHFPSQPIVAFTPSCITACSSKIATTNFIVWFDTTMARAHNLLYLNQVPNHYTTDADDSVSVVTDFFQMYILNNLVTTNQFSLIIKDEN